MGLPPASERWNLDQFLAWEAEQPERHEFVAGEVFAMTGARDAHNTVVLNIATFLRERLRGTPCRPYIADMKLLVEAADAAFYPDILVTCDARDFASDADLAKRHPRLLVEVLSESTAAYDRGDKFRHYRAIPTLEEYVLVEPVRLGVDLFRRDASGHWVLHPYAAGDTVEFASLGLALPIAAIYEDVVLPGAAVADPPADPACGDRTTVGTARSRPAFVHRRSRVHRATRRRWAAIAQRCLRTPPRVLQKHNKTTRTSAKKCTQCLPDCRPAPTIRPTSRIREVMAGNRQFLPISQWRCKCKRN